VTTPSSTGRHAAVPAPAAPLSERRLRLLAGAAVCAVFDPRRSALPAAAETPVAVEPPAGALRRS
jgi:hypothetical protein